MKRTSMWVTLGMSLFLVLSTETQAADQAVGFGPTSQVPISAEQYVAGLRLTSPQPKPQVASNPPGNQANPTNLGTIFALIGQIPIDVIDYPKPPVPQNPLEPVNKLGLPDINPGTGGPD
jgi:hypothetical protein